MQAAPRYEGNLYEEICTVLQESFELSSDKLAPHARIVEDLDLDSIDLFDLLVLLEKRHGVQLSLNDFKGSETLADITAHLAGLLDEKPNES